MSMDPNISNPPPRGGGSNNVLYFLVGGLVVLAGVFVFLYTNDYVGGESGSPAPAAQTAPAQTAPAPAAPGAPAEQPATGSTTTQ